MNHHIQTRLLILSDTHGLDFSAEDRPQQRVDVAIHCGDLTDGSKLEEFQATIQLLKRIDAPLKLAIAGNHDFTIDVPVFQKIVADALPPLDPELVAKEYGVPGEARQLFAQAKEAGIMFLDEGAHRIPLENGGLLTVYASPYTPSLGGLGFQYHPERGHHFALEKGLDVAITHGPPHGIMDRTNNRKRTGSPHLFTTVAEAKPQVHCFGHIHEDWGAKLVTWREFYGEPPTHFTAIDNDQSYVIENLTSLNPFKFDTPEDTKQKLDKFKRYKQDRCCTASVYAGDGEPATGKRNANTIRQRSTFRQ